jgi:hypothetical protein
MCVAPSLLYSRSPSFLYLVCVCPRSSFTSSVCPFFLFLTIFPPPPTLTSLYCGTAASYVRKVGLLCPGLSTSPARTRDSSTQPVTECEYIQCIVPTECEFIQSIFPSECGLIQYLLCFSGMLVKIVRDSDGIKIHSVYGSNRM